MAHSLRIMQNSSRTSSICSKCVTHFNIQVGLPQCEVNIRKRSVSRLCTFSIKSVSTPVPMKCNQYYQRYSGSIYAVNQYTSRKTINQNDSQKGLRHFSIQSAAESVAETQAGWFKSLSESTVVSYAQEFFVSVHDTTGLPWWASIMLTTVILRSCITMPLAVYQNFILAKVENLQLEMPDIVKELKMETAHAIKKYNWTQKQARVIYNRSLRKQWKKLVVRDNCHPFKASLLLWVQLPMWICFSTALRNLVYMMPNADTAAQLVCLELSVGGFAWIPNLTAADSSLVLPVAFGLVNLAIIELQNMTRTKQATKLQAIVTNLFRGLSLVMIPIAANVPACLCLYWTTSSVFGLAQNLLLLSPKVKRFTRIPDSASQLDQPYQHIASKIAERAAWMAKPFTVK